MNKSVLAIALPIIAMGTAMAASKRAEINVKINRRITVVTAPKPTPKPTPTPAPTPTPTPQPVAAARLLPLDLSDMRLWNWGGKWHASEWANNMGPIPWHYDRVRQPDGGDTYFRLDSAGAPELMANGGTPSHALGLWEADVTLPQLKDGLVVAPLWLYDGASRDEIDFEYAGRNGLDVTLHASLNGVMQYNTVRLFAGRDMSGERHRFGIKVDQPAGYVEMYLDGALVHRWSRAGMKFFVTHPVKPVISMWAADSSNSDFVSWVGRWGGLPANASLTMTVHGYGYTPLR